MRFYFVSLIGGCCTGFLLDFFKDLKLYGYGEGKILECLERRKEYNQNMFKFNIVLNDENIIKNEKVMSPNLRRKFSTLMCKY